MHFITLVSMFNPDKQDRELNMRAVGAGITVVFTIAIIYVWNPWQNPEEAEFFVEPEPHTQNSTMASTEPTLEVSGTETDKTTNTTIVESSLNPDSEVLETDAFPVEETAANTNRNVVEIPEGGYLVEDSMKYFVPKHERTPGNLGGPPPPPFMVPENAQGERRVEALLPPAPDAPAQ